MGSRSANDSPHLSATVAGTFTMAEDLTVTRRGYGAMQLAGPYVINQIIKEALHLYPDALHIVTEVGALRAAEGNWHQVLEPSQLRQAIFDNLDHLGLDAIDAVNLHISGLTNPPLVRLLNHSPRHHTAPAPRLARAEGTPMLANTVKS